MGKSNTSVIESFREKYLLDLLDKCYKMLPDGDYGNDIIEIKKELQDKHIEENKKRIEKLPKPITFYFETHVAQLMMNIEELIPKDNPIFNSNSFNYLKKHQDKV